MLSGTVVNVPTLPARSVTTTWPVTPAPSVLITSGLLLLVVLTPDIASLRVNNTLTLLLIQPFAFGAGVGVPNVSTGGVASRFRLIELLVVPPADVTLQVNVALAVSVVTMLVTHPVLERMLAGGVLIDHATCTSLVYQPLRPNVPVTTGCTTGGP